MRTGMLKFSATPTQRLRRYKGSSRSPAVNIFPRRNRSSGKMVDILYSIRCLSAPLYRLQGFCTIAFNHLNFPRLTAQRPCNFPSASRLTRYHIGLNATATPTMHYCRMRLPHSCTVSDISASHCSSHSLIGKVRASYHDVIRTITNLSARSHIQL